MIAIVIVRMLATQVESAAKPNRGVLRCWMEWLKRAQVASRLGRSIATVRRLEDEGSLLPQHGPGKVRLFSSRDVDRIAERAAQAGNVLSETRFNSEGGPAWATGTVNRSRGGALEQERHDHADANYQRLAASHSAMRAELLALLERLIELRPSYRAVCVLEEMLTVLGSSEEG